MFKNPLKLGFGKVMELVFFAGVTAGAVVGSIAGVAAGLAFGGLMAPKSGEDLRHDIAQKTGELTNEISETVKKKSDALYAKANKIRNVLSEDNGELA